MSMSKIMELRNKRNVLWEQTKAFLEEHRDEKGMVEASAVDVLREEHAGKKGPASAGALMQ